MKSLAALLVAVALVSSAFAQNPIQQERQKNRKGPVVAPAFKPILLHTGKPITPNDKQQLLVSVKKTYAIKSPGVKVTMKPQQAPAPVAKTVTLTWPSMSQAGFVDTEWNNPSYVNPELSQITFGPGESSYIDFIFVATANTTYTMTFKVSAFTQNPQYTILPSYPPGNGPNGIETFAGNANNDEFAYSFVSNASGILIVSLYSPNAYWTFGSCEIMATPIN
jgi:hypothetical protein